MACSLHLFAWLDFRTKALLSGSCNTKNRERLFKRCVQCMMRELSVCLSVSVEGQDRRTRIMLMMLQEESTRRGKQDNWCNFLFWVRRRQKEMPKFPLIRGTHDALTPCRVIRRTYYLSTHWEFGASSCIMRDKFGSPHEMLQVVLDQKHSGNRTLWKESMKWKSRKIWFININMNEALTSKAASKSFRWRRRMTFPLLSLPIFGHHMKH